MMNTTQDSEVDQMATPAQAVDEWRFNVGADNADHAWLLHDRDVWVRNPYYVGPPQPHPEDETFDEQWLDEIAAARAAQDDNWLPSNLDIADQL